MILISSSPTLYWGAAAPTEEKLSIWPQLPKLDVIIYCGTVRELALFVETSDVYKFNRALSDLTMAFANMGTCIICLNWLDRPHEPPSVWSIYNLRLLMDNYIKNQGMTACVACAMGVNRSFFALFSILCRSDDQINKTVEHLSNLRGIDYSRWFKERPLWLRAWRLANDAVAPYAHRIASRGGE